MLCRTMYNIDPSVLEISGWDSYSGCNVHTVAACHLTSSRHWSLTSSVDLSHEQGTLVRPQNAFSLEVEAIPLHVLQQC